MNKFKLLLYFVLTLVTIGANAQSPDLKWGKFNKSDLEMTECRYEKDAEAIVLDHHGHLQFITGYINIRHHLRIKIFKESGIERADIEIPYYSTDEMEMVRQVKAHTINVLPDGKIEKIKVEPKNIYTVDLNEHWKAIRFTFPAVKVGTILEYSYTMLTKNYTFMDGWLFQTDIPTRNSKFVADVPDQLDYRILYKGRRLLQKYGQQEYSNEWELNNLPSIKEEPYVANYMDWAEKINFQLAGYTRVSSTYSSSDYVTMMTTWENLAKERLDDENYRFYLNKRNRVKDLVASLIDEDDNNLEKAQKIYDYVINNYQWNDKNRMYTSQSFNDFTAKKEGTSAEINLYLILLLQTAGLDADPVLISTRSHGIVSKSYPFISQFNYMICNVNIGGTDYQLDAIDKLRPFGLISRKCLNDDGYLLDEDNPRWIEIKPDTNAYEYYYINAAVNEEGKIEYDIQVKYFGYIGLNHRRRAMRDPNNESLKKSLSDIDYDMTEILYENVEHTDKPLAVKMKVNYDVDLQENDMIYLVPLIINDHEENPFKTEIREFPIDFSYTFKETYIFQLTIPEGFEVASVPESANVVLPDKNGRFLFLAERRDNFIKMSVNFSIDKPTISSGYYPHLKQFYNLAISKFSENIVLKRI